MEAGDRDGFVGQLEALLLRVLVTSSRDAPIDAKTLAPFLAAPETKPIFGDDVLAGRSLKELKTELERAYLTRLFRETGGDIERMGQTLGVKTSNLYHWLRRVGIEVRSLRHRL